MSTKTFTSNDDDLSTDRGCQFEFYSDKYHDGFTGRFQTSVTGPAASLLRAAAPTCPSCGTRTGSEFCPGCGSPVATEPRCSGCGHAPSGSPRFCPERGNKMQTWQ